MKTFTVNKEVEVQIPTVPRYLRDSENNILDTKDFTKAELRKIADAWKEKLVARGK